MDSWMGTKDLYSNMLWSVQLREGGWYYIVQDNWRSASPSELTPIIFDMEITHLDSEVSSWEICEFIAEESNCKNKSFCSSENHGKNRLFQRYWRCRRYGVNIFQQVTFKTKDLINRRRYTWYTINLIIKGDIKINLRSVYN